MMGERRRAEGVVPVANLSWPQRTALVSGALLVLWGLVDFVVGRSHLGVVHAVAGALVVATAFHVRRVRLAGTLISVVFLVVFVFGVNGGAMDAGLVGNGAHLLLGFGSVALAESCVWCEQRAKTARSASRLS
jgi:hypothetical protein